MKQIEITVRLQEDIQSAFKKLENNGFSIIRKGKINDIYLTSKLNELNTNNIQDILKKSIILRSLELNGKEVKTIMYKDKELDINGNVISEEKTSIVCDDFKSAEKLFSFFNFERLINVKYYITTYAKDSIEYVFQQVENLGTFVEYENLNDFSGKTLEKINETKKQMLKQLKDTGIIITDETNVKKAYELIVKQYNL